MASKIFKNGVSFGRKIFRDNLKVFGKDGVHKSDKAHVTCKKYGWDKTVKKNKKGKVLTNGMRENYRGMNYGLFWEYQNYEKSSEKQVNNYQKTSALKEKESKRISALEDKHYALYGPHRNALRAEINKELNKSKPNKDKIAKLKAELVQTSFASAYSAGLYDD